MLELCTTAARSNFGLYRGPERRTGAVASTRWLARMLDEMDHGVLLVTSNGALRHANQPAHLVLAQGSSLCLATGQVQASHRDQHNTFAAALADAQRGKRRLIALGSPPSALSIALVPMGSDGPEAESLVLLVLGKRQSCQTLTVDFFARTQGLTNAEAKVLRALCDGLRPKDAARHLGVAVSTIRTQISSIRAKTQTASIFDLVSHVTTLPPITLAMKTLLTH